MAYTPTNWTNSVYDADGKVIQKGTPLLAENMNAIESAIATIANGRGEPNGTASLDKDGVVPSSQLPTNLKEIRIVASIAERDELEKFEGLRVLVTGVESWVEYVWDGTLFIKVADSSNLDIVLTWANVEGKPTEFKPTSHTHVEADITDLDKYTREQVDAKLGNKSDSDHTHNQFTQITNNAERIETLEASSGQLHTHANKDVLDKISYSGAKPYVDLIALEELASKKVSYNDLLNKPKLPTKTSELTNDSEYVKSNAGRVHVSYTPSDIPTLQPNDIVLRVL